MNRARFIDRIHYVDPPNKEPKPFIWTVHASEIAQTSRTKAALARWAISTEENDALQHELRVTGAQV